MKLRPDLSMTKESICEECYCKFQVWIYADTDTCPSCRQMVALERIADVLEHWVGLQ